MYYTNIKDYERLMDRKDKTSETKDESMYSFFVYLLPLIIVGLIFMI